MLFAGLHGITQPDLYHWLTTREAKGATLTDPSPSNTAFLPAPSQLRLSLTPPSGPGRDSRAPEGAGGVVAPQAHMGWSWADVQVALPVHHISREIGRFDDVPFLYLGHPIAAVMSEITPGHASERIRSMLNQFVKHVGERIAGGCLACALEANDRLL